MINYDTSLLLDEIREQGTLVVPVSWQEPGIIGDDLDQLLDRICNSLAYLQKDVPSLLGV